MKKAEESRHNETVGYLIIIIGSVFFVGGLLETVIKLKIQRAPNNSIPFNAAPLQSFRLSFNVS